MADIEADPVYPIAVTVKLSDIQSSGLGPYRGTTPIDADVLMWDGRTRVSLQRAIEIINNAGGSIGTICKRFGDWCVTDTGVDCLSHPYWVEKGRLFEEDWIPHMAEKNWVNVADFSMALNAARKIYPKKEPRSSGNRAPAGMRLNSEEKEVVKKYRQKKQMKRARRILGVQKSVSDLSKELE